MPLHESGFDSKPTNNKHLIDLKVQALAATSPISAAGIRTVVVGSGTDKRVCAFGL
jgi:hypothetical protein